MKKNWISESVFYHIYPLGFCDAPKRNDFHSYRETRLDKVWAWTTHMKNLGINALYLGPVFESTAHGYDTADYYHVDRRLGDNETLVALVEHLHANGIRVILDGVFNHVGRDFWAFRDVQQNQKNSRFYDWFAGLDFSKRSCFGDLFGYEGWNGHYDLVKLNLANVEVRQHLLGAVQMWITEFGIDGLRLDVADCLDIAFQQELAAFCKNIRKDFFLVGEVVHGNYNKWVNRQTLDSVTNYECYKGLYSSLNDNNYFEIAYSLNRQFGSNGIYKDLPLYSFVDNHDVNRIGSQLLERRNLPLVYCMMFTMPGIPSIYYGSEWGIEGVKENGSDAPLRTALELEEFTFDDQKRLMEELRDLVNLRKGSTALQCGTYRQVHLAHNQFAFIRESSKEVVLVVFNSSPHAVTFELRPEIADCHAFKGVLSGEMVQLKSGRLSLDNMPGFSYKVFRMKK